MYVQWCKSIFEQGWFVILAMFDLADDTVGIQIFKKNLNAIIDSFHGGLGVRHNKNVILSFAKQLY